MPLERVCVAGHDCPTTEACQCRGCAARFRALPLDRRFRRPAGTERKFLADGTTVPVRPNYSSFRHRTAVPSGVSVSLLHFKKGFKKEQQLLGCTQLRKPGSAGARPPRARAAHRWPIRSARLPLRPAGVPPPSEERGRTDHRSSAGASGGLSGRRLELMARE